MNEPRARYETRLAGLLFVVAAALLAVGWSMFDTASQPRARSGFFDGPIAFYVLTDDQEPVETALSVVAGPAHDSFGVEDQAGRALDLRLNLGSIHDSPPRWAIVLSGHAVMPSQNGSTDGRVPARSGDWKTTDLSADVEVLYSTSANQTVLVGSFVGPLVPQTESGDYGPIYSANLTVPIAYPFLADLTETYAISTPYFGALQSRAVSQTGSLETVVSDTIGPDLYDEMEGGSGWSLPASQEVWFADSDRGGFQEFGLSPTPDDVRLWRGIAVGGGDPRERLKIDAMFTRPGSQERAGRALFLAGVVISGALGALFWGLELVFGPERRPVLKWSRGRWRRAARSAVPTGPDQPEERGQEDAPEKPPAL